MTVSDTHADTLRDSLSFLHPDSVVLRPALVALDALVADRDRERARADRVEAILLGALAVVDEQAEDDGLWALNLDGTQPIVEAYLAQELRRLHAAVEHASAALSAGSGGRGTTP